MRSICNGKTLKNKGIAEGYSKGEMIVHVIAGWQERFRKLSQHIEDIVSSHVTRGV